MEAVIAVVALLFVLFVALGAYATVKVVGAAKRGVDRTITQARRTVEDHTLRARVLRPAGPGRGAGPAPAEAAHLDAGHPGGAAGGRGRGRVPQGVPRPSSSASARTAASWTTNSSAWSPSPTGPRSPSGCPTLRERTERVIKSADSLRWAARDRARRFADDDLDTLSAQIDVEAGALRHWTTRNPPRCGPTRRSPRPQPPRGRPGRRPRARPAESHDRGSPVAVSPVAARSRPSPRSPRRARGRRTRGRRSPAPRAPLDAGRVGAARLRSRSQVTRGRAAVRGLRQVTSSSCPAMSRSSPIQRPTCRRGRWSATASPRCP